MTAVHTPDGPRPKTRSTAAPRTPIAAALQRQLRRKGWTYKRLAAEVGVLPHHVSRWCTGERTPGTETLRKLAAALGVRVETLMTAPADFSSPDA